MRKINQTSFDWSSFWTELELVREPVNTSHTLPPVSYTSDEVLKHECDVIFSNHWIAVGRTDRWLSPGHYVAMDIGGTPVIVVRDRDNQLRAYANTCRHRGAKLLSSSGQCRVIRCPFHAWSYGLDGRLVMAPQMERTPGFDIADYGLHEFRVKTHAGFVFVCLSDSPPDFDVLLGDFDAFHAPWRLDTLVTTRRQDFTVACNWKLFLEVFNEYYHLPIVHAETVNALYADPQPADDVTGHFATQFGLTQGSSALLEDSQDKRLPPIASLNDQQRNGTRYTWLFPNMAFAAGSEAVWVLEALPVTATLSQVSMTTCFPVQTIQHDNFDANVTHYYSRFDAAMAEDIPALENQQAGLTSIYAKQGRFSHLEPSVGYFACWYARQMRRDTSARLPQLV